MIWRQVGTVFCMTLIVGCASAPSEIPDNNTTQPVDVDDSVIATDACGTCDRFGGDVDRRRGGHAVNDQLVAARGTLAVNEDGGQTGW